MDLSFKSILLITTLILTGLSSGFFFAWEVTVIPGTKRVSDDAYLETMQSINRAILNPAFFVIFFGTLISLVASSYLHFRTAIDLTFGLLLAATLVYLLGSIGITIFGNVPLNEALDVVHLQELSKEALHDLRMSYETPWNRWHTLRTIFSVLAFILSLLAGLWKSLVPGLS